MKYQRTLAYILLFNLLFITSCLKSEDDDAIRSNGPDQKQPYKFQWFAIADSSVNSLNANFWNAGKYYNNATPSDGQFHYWPQAHALDVVIDAYIRTSEAKYETYMNDWFTGVKVMNGNTFLNEFYDDMEWNALAMLRAYEVTNDAKWLDESVALWNDIKGGWNEQMGGGIAWKKSQLGYKNTPANAPACILAARLYRETNSAEYLDWAKKIYNWQRATLVNRENGLVYDGINQNGDGVLQTDAGWRFSYNQGTYIGAALELYNITKEAPYLQEAVKTANNLLSDNVMSPSGIMRPGDNGDGGLFNGIGIRYLTLLAMSENVPSGDRQRYIDYIKKNAETLWLKGTQRPRVIFSNNWNTLPGSTGYLNPQLSGNMVVEAMALLESKDLINK